MLTLHVFCDANGDVHIEYPSQQFLRKVRHELWNPDYFLGITMGFGHFSFATARVVDGLWDILVGRCGQAGLALLAYPVLRRSLNPEMEQHAASLRLFASLAFDKLSMTAAWNVLRDIFEAGHSARGGQEDAKPAAPRRSRQVCRYLEWTSVLGYWLAFPTITSITTGYQPRYEPYLSPPRTDSLIPMAPFTIPGVILYSGARIGYLEPVALNSSSSDPSMRTLWQCKSPLETEFTVRLPTGPRLTITDYETCFLPTLGVLDEVPPKGTYPQLKSCPDGTCNCTLSLEKTTFDFDVVNITSSNLTLRSHTWSLDGGLYFTRQCASNEINNNCLDVGNVLLTDGNYTLSRDFMQVHGFCRPLNEYKWGFSSLALLTHLSITLLVASILMALHFDAFRNGKSDRHALDNNLYSDVVIVSRELERLPFGRPLEDVAASELERVVKAKDVRICIENHDLERPRGIPLPTCFRRRKGTCQSEHEAKRDLL